MIVDVMVTSEHIRQGGRYDPRTHPLAVAVGDALGRRDALYQITDRVAFNKDDDSIQAAAVAPCVMLPPKAIAWGHVFSGRGTGEPFTFAVDVPDTINQGATRD